VTGAGKLSLLLDFAAAHRDFLWLVETLHFDRAAEMSALSEIA
jgi:hypothetical protein